jgi:hypothetical protein
MLYLFSHLVAEYETVTAKKLKDDQYIFHVTKQ